MGDFRFESLNERQVKALAEGHIRMYENRIRRANQGFGGIRVGECTQLLDLWRSVYRKLALRDWRLSLTRFEVAEIKDALASGDFDKVLDDTQDAPS